MQRQLSQLSGRARTLSDPYPELNQLSMKSNQERKEMKANALTVIAAALTSSALELLVTNSSLVVRVKLSLPLHLASLYPLLGSLLSSQS